MSELNEILRRSNPERLARDAIGLAALSALILLAMFLPGLA